MERQKTWEISSRGGLSLLSATLSTSPPPSSPFTPTCATSLWYYEENAAEREAGDEEKRTERRKETEGKEPLTGGVARFKCRGGTESTK